MTLVSAGASHLQDASPSADEVPWPQTWRDPGWALQVTSAITDAEPMYDHLGCPFVPRTLAIVLTPNWTTVTVIGRALHPAGDTGIRRRFVVWGWGTVSATHSIPMPTWITKAAIDGLRTTDDPRARSALKAMPF